MFSLQFTKGEMVHIFAKLRNKTSSEHEELPYSIAKEFSSFLKQPTIHFLSYSFELEAFTDQLKTSKVIPEHKNIPNLSSITLDLHRSLPCSPRY